MKQWAGHSSWKWQRSGEEREGKMKRNNQNTAMRKKEMAQYIISPHFFTLATAF